MSRGAEHDDHFVAPGYLAVSFADPGTEQFASLQGRQWLAANTLAEVRLVIEGSMLAIVVTVKGTVYVRSPVGPVEDLKDRNQACSASLKMMTPQHTCSCWCLASVGNNVLLLLSE